jgi:hypothetical protein
MKFLLFLPTNHLQPPFLLSLDRRCSHHLFLIATLEHHE